MNKKLIRKMLTASGGPLFPWQNQNTELIDDWKFKLTPASRSRVLSGKGVETDKQYTERRKKETTKRTWRSDAADVAHGIGEGILALNPYTAIPYYGAKVGLDFLNGTYGWHTALNASVPLFHMAPQAVGLREATNVALEDVANTGNGIKTLWNNGKLILKDIPRKAENFYRAVNKDAINDAKKYGIIRGRESRVGDSYPFFGRSSEPYHDTKYVIEGTPESADWISTYKYVYSKNPEIVKLSKIPDRDYSKAYDTIIGSPESNGFLRIGAYDKEFLEGYEALPMTNRQLNVSPSSNFAYWKKLPVIGWRKYNFKQGGKMNILEFLKNGSGIHIKEKNKGKFTSYCGGKVTDECILKGKNSSNPAIRKRATFAANARKWKHLLGGNLLLGPMPSAINNPKVKNILSYMPFTGSAIDIETTMKNPSIKNSINAAISTGSDVLGGWLIRDVNKAKKAYNEAKAAEKTARELLNLSRKSNVIARSVTEELRRLKDNWEKAYWDLQLKDRLNFILKYLDYPIYGGWLAGDATINYILNLKKGGTLKFLEGGKTSWWNKAINFVNNSGLGEVALNALSTYTLNKLIGASSDVAKALVDKDKASKILQANLAAELEANDIQLNNVNPENPNAMSGDIVKNFIKNKLLSLKMALINLESNLEKAEIDWQTLLLKNLNTTNMWAGIGSTLMQG